MTKLCGHCKQVVSIDSFGKDRTTKDGKRSWCKECRKVKNREYRKKLLGTEKLVQKNKKDKDKLRFSGNRQLVLKRDGRKCVICGIADRIQVHHMDETGRGKPIEKHNNNPSNLVCLCVSCHGKVHFSPTFEKEKQFLLDYMMSVK